MEACEHGRVDIDNIFGAKARGVYSTLNIEGQHRSAVAAAKAPKAAGGDKHEHGHGHSHG